MPKQSSKSFVTMPSNLSAAPFYLASHIQSCLFADKRPFRYQSPLTRQHDSREKPKFDTATSSAKKACFFPCRDTNECCDQVECELRHDPLLVVIHGSIPHRNYGNGDSYTLTDSQKRKKFDLGVRVILELQEIDNKAQRMTITYSTDETSGSISNRSKSLNISLVP